jgi:hypothetical protein
MSCCSAGLERNEAAPGVSGGVKIDMSSQGISDRSIGIPKILDLTRLLKLFSAGSWLANNLSWPFPFWAKAAFSLRSGMQAGAQSRTRLGIWQE